MIPALFMNPALLGVALAAPPVAIDAVEWAQPFSLDAPAPWTMTAEPTSMQRGWLVQLRAPIDHLRPTAVGQRALYADRTPVMRLSPPLQSTCALVVVPGDVDMATVRWFFGSTTLPEQLDTPGAAAELQSAVDAGIQPMKPANLAAPIQVADINALHRLAEARFVECSSAPSRDNSLVF